MALDDMLDVVFGVGFAAGRPRPVDGEARMTNALTTTLKNFVSRVSPPVTLCVCVCVCVCV